MSWLKKLFEIPAPPPPPKTAEQEKREKLSAYFQQHREVFGLWALRIQADIKAAIDNELAQLSALNLPLPTQTNSEADTQFCDLEYYSYEYENLPEYIVMKYPLFRVPNFYCYVARTRGAFEGMYYLIPTTGISSDRIRKEHQNGDLSTFLAQFKGRWFNRDPYQVFHFCNEKVGFKLSPGEIQADHPNLFHGKPPEPLKELSGYAPAEVRRMEYVHRLYNGIAGEQFIPNLPRVLFVQGHTFDERTHTNYLHDAILFDLEPPQPRFPDTPVTLLITPPPAVKLAAMRRVLENILPLTHPFSFELIDDGTTITYHLVCATQDRINIEQQLRLAVPECGIAMQQSSTYSLPIHSITCTLAAFSLRPLPDTAHDPLTQAFNILEETKPGETVALQIICSPFPSAIVQTLLDGMRAGYHYHDNWRTLGETSFHYKDGSFAKQIQSKLPLWQTTIRVLASNPKTVATLQRQYLDKFALPDNPWQCTTQQATIHRRDMSESVLLTTAELTSLAHFPMMPIECDRLEQASMKNKWPPDLFTSGAVQIGKAEARGQTKQVAIPDSVRSRHLYIVGKSGSGKSTLITNIARQDMERGDGVCVIDPHGDLVSDLLDYIPKHRINDTIYFNVSDRAHPIGLDMMHANNEAEIEILTDDLVTTFRRLTETWGERMETILRYAFNTLLRIPGATFLDIQKLLTNEGWRATVVRRLNVSLLADFWFNQYVNMPKDAAQPILSRMTKIVLSPTLNAIFGQSTSRLNFNDVIRNRKILLVNLGGDSRDRNNEQLAISDEMKKLIGSVVVSQLQIAAMRQASIPEAERVPCRFFVDEFQNFVSGAFPKILSEARKYKLCLTVAHQYISQLDDATRNAVFGNVGTMIVMPLGQKDAAYLGAELGMYNPEDVANLSPERHEALCRPTTQAADTFLFTTLTPPPITQSSAQAIIDHTRATYSARTDAETPQAPVPDNAESPARRVPMREMPKDFASTAERILHYVSRAGYLTTSQIIELCYAHLSDASKRPAASRDLKKLTESKKLKTTNWGEGKVFYVGSRCNPSAHNVAVRDMLIKIWQSGYEVAEVNLSPALGALSPDLLVSFLCADGSLLLTYWEYDAGTEGITEIVKKVARYIPYSATARVCFVCNTRERMQALVKTVQADFIEYCVLSELITLDALIFISRTQNDTYSFFQNGRG